MKSFYNILAGVTLAGGLAGCEVERCLEQLEDRTLQLVQEFNQGRCMAVLEGDRREIFCDSGQLTGEINARVFELELNAESSYYLINSEGFSSRCGVRQWHTEEASMLNLIRERLIEAVREMEVD